MILRLAQPNELGTIKDLVAAAYAPYADQGISLPDVTGGLESDCSAGRLWVAVKEDRIMGALVLGQDGARAHLRNVAVAPSARGQGVGKALIIKAEDLAREAGCIAMDLTTHRLMPTNVALYAHLGWTETGREGDRVFMTKRLGDRAP